MEACYSRLIEKRISMLNIEQIKEIIPHRYPFLLIDQIVDMKVGEKAHGSSALRQRSRGFRDIFRNTQLCLECCLWKLWRKLEL